MREKAAALINEYTFKLLRNQWKIKKAMFKMKAIS